MCDHTGGFTIYELIGRPFEERIYQCSCGLLLSMVQLPPMVVKRLLHQAPHYKIPAMDGFVFGGIQPTLIGVPGPQTIYGLTFKATEESWGTFCGYDDAARTEIEEFLSVTKGMKTLLDIGALFGLFSLTFCASTGGTALAVEPSPDAFPVLLKNVHANPDFKITAFQRFAGQQDGRPVHCRKDWKHLVADPNGNEVVQEFTIDSLAVAPDCVKIDVEGHEWAILKGMEKTVARSHPVIFLEAHCSFESCEAPPEELYRLLRDYGYRVRDLFGGQAIDGLFKNMPITHIVCE